MNTNPLSLAGQVEMVPTSRMEITYPSKGELALPITNGIKNPLGIDNYLG